MKASVEQLKAKRLILPDPSTQQDTNTPFMIQTRVAVTERITCQRDWDRVESTVQSILLEDDPAVDTDLTVLDMGRFVNLVELKAGDSCCRRVTRVVIVGLKKLERIVVGGRSFRTLNYLIIDGKDPNRHFFLKDCEKLKEVKIGRGSFKDFSVCEIENLPSLESMDLGCVDLLSCVFCFANLELRSGGRRRN